MPNRTHPLPADIIAALQRGGLLEALKLVLADKKAAPKREATMLDAQDKGHSKPLGSAPTSSKPSHLSPGEVPRSNKDVWLLLVLLVGPFIAYYLFSH